MHSCIVTVTTDIYFHLNVKLNSLNRLLCHLIVANVIQDNQMTKAHSSNEPSKMLP